MATEYFVSPNGSNNGRGTKDSPWQTLQFAVNKLRSGDTLTVRGGTYSEVLTIGTSNVSIRAYRGETPILDGAYRYPPGRALFEGQYSGGYSHGYVYAALVDIKADNVELDGLEITRSRGRAILADRQSNVTIRNCDIHDVRKNAISLLRCRNVSVIDTKCIRAVNFAQFARNSSELGSWGASVKTRGTNGVLFDGIICGETWGEGINPLFSSNVTVRNCVSYDNWRLNLYADNVSNGLYENNFSYHTEGSGIPRSAGLVLRVENASGGQGGSESGNINENLIIRNNFFVRNSVGISSGKQNSSYVNKNVEIHHNTIVDPTGPAMQFNKGTNDTGSIRGNIIIGGRIDGPTGFSISNNLFYDTSTSGSGAIVGNPKLANRNARLRQGQTDPSAYKITAGSAAINVAPNISGLNRDFFGGKRPVGNGNDMGAHEYRSGEVVVPVIEPNFSTEITAGAAPLTVQFRDETFATNGVDTWAWFANGERFSTAQNPRETFTKPGSYTIRLDVSNQDGRDSITKQDLIEVTAPVEVVASFDARPESGAAPLTVSFTDTSTSQTPITSWRWDFGDGNTSTEPEPSHTYLEAGTYTVRLTVTTQSGSDSVTKNNLIAVSEPLPVAAAFDADPLTGLSPLTVQFTDRSTSTEPIRTWLWEFGDGITSTEQNPEHTYDDAEGVFNVKLTVTTASETDSANRTIRVLPEGTGGTDCAGNLLANAAFDNGQQGWSFSGAGTLDTAGGIAAVRVTGTGTTQLTQSGIALEQGDELLIEFLAWTSAEEDDLEVEIIQNSAPYAHLIPDQKFVVNRQPKVFSALVSVDEREDDARFRFRWTRPTNGTVSIDRVCLQPQEGVEMLQVGFAATPTTGMAPLTVQLSDSTTPEDAVTSWAWYVNGELFSQDREPVLTIVNAGTYSIRLAVTSDLGTGEKTILDMITVEESPVVDGNADFLQSGLALGIRLGTG